MSESAPEGGNTSGSTPTADGDFKPITSQDELNRLLNERLARERSKYADYKDVKAKAAKLDEIEQANKSEIDKAMDRVAKAEAEAATVPNKVADALRSHLVALHKIPADDAELFLTASDPDLLLKQVDRLVARGSEAAADQRKTGNHVPREGKTPAPPADDPLREFTGRLFASGNP